MIAVARYLLAEHLRSRTFAAPFAVLLAAVIVLYAQAPNPVLETAGTVAAALFFVQAWAALAFFDSQGDTDRHVVIAAAGVRAFVLGRLLAGASLAVVSAVIAVAYPLLAGRFSDGPTAGELVLCLLATLAATASATALAALFAQPIVRNRAVAAVGLAACALLTVPLEWPAVSTARALDTDDASEVPARLAGDLASVAAFGVAVAITCALLWRRRE